MSKKPAKAIEVFFSYSHKDEELRDELEKHLSILKRQGVITGWHDRRIGAGREWEGEIDAHLNTADVILLLISSDFLASDYCYDKEMKRAMERHEAGEARVIPVILRPVDWKGATFGKLQALPKDAKPVTSCSNPDEAFLDVAQGIRAAVEELTGPSADLHPVSEKPSPDREIAAPEEGSGQLRFMKAFSEDGQPVAGDETLHAPLPEFDPRFLKELKAPGGAVNLRDKFYIEREADAHLKRQIVNRGTTTTIRAPDQTGKTSLLMRGIHYARRKEAKIVCIDFQSFGSGQLTSADIFLQELAESICRELRLDEANLQKAWRGSRGASKKLTYYLEDHVLPEFEEPIILAMDEADFLLQTSFHRDFFSLVRSWHNRRASHSQWEKLNIVIAIVTEPYRLIDDIHRSPFNVGLQLFLEDFDEAQVRDLNWRHGSSVNEGDFPQLMALLNGHPYLTRKALYTLVTERLTWSELAHDATTDYGPFSDHLRHLHWLLYNKPSLREALKQVIRHNRCVDGMALFQLLQAGLVKPSGDMYACRCGLYRLYFEDRL